MIVKWLYEMCCESLEIVTILPARSLRVTELRLEEENAFCIKKKALKMLRSSVNTQIQVETERSLPWGSNSHWLKYATLWVSFTLKRMFQQFPFRAQHENMSHEWHVQDQSISFVYPPFLIQCFCCWCSSWLKVETWFLIPWNWNIPSSYSFRSFTSSYN